MGQKMSEKEKVLEGKYEVVEWKYPNSRFFKRYMSYNERYNIHVTLDKQTYRPGETMYIRCVILHAFTSRPFFQRPINNNEIDMYIYDGTGKEYFKGWPQSQNHNVNSFQWKLPNSMLGGEYTLKMVKYVGMGICPGYRKFKVKKYTPPKLKKEIVFLRKSYSENDTVIAILSVCRSDGDMCDAENTKIESTVNLDNNEIFKQLEGLKLNALGKCELSFKLPEKIEEGIGSLSFKISEGMTETASKTLPIVLKKLKAFVYPEGGNVIANVKNGIYVECFTPTDDTGDFEAEIVEEEEVKEEEEEGEGEGDEAWDSPKKKVLGMVRTVHEGRAYFELDSPDPKKKYYLNVLKPSGIVYPVEIGPIQETGVCMRLLNKGRNSHENFEISLSTPDEMEHTIHIGLFKKEKCIKMYKLKLEKMKEEIVQFDPGPWNGVLRVTVYDHWMKQALCERIIFRRQQRKIHFDITTDRQTYCPGSKVKLRIQTIDDEGRPVRGHFGLTVSDDSVFKMAEKRKRFPSLQAQHFLENEVKDFELFDSESFFSYDDPLKISPDVKVDLLCGTQGWRRYIYKPIEKSDEKKSIKNTKKYLEEPQNKETLFSVFYRNVDKKVMNEGRKFEELFSNIKSYEKNLKTKQNIPTVAVVYRQRQHHSQQPKIIQNDKAFDVLFKILLIGDMGVGKSNILLRYSENSFNPKHVSTIGVDFKIRTLRKNDKTIKLQIWDTAGQERFRTITNSYYKGAHGIIMVYDITEKKSFENLIQWHEDVRAYADENVSVILVGNKIDMVRRRQISKEEGENFARRLNIPFLETSARDAINIEDAFLEIVDEIYKKLFENSYSSSYDDDDYDKVIISEGPSKSKATFGSGLLAGLKNLNLKKKSKATTVNYSSDEDEEDEGEDEDEEDEEENEKIDEDKSLPLEMVEIDSSPPIDENIIIEEQSSDAESEDSFVDDYPDAGSFVDLPYLAEYAYKPKPKSNDEETPPGRDDFSETVLFISYAKTDRKGVFEKEFFLSDSITSFCVFIDSWLADGTISSSREFLIPSQKPFFVSPKWPNEVTTGDIIHLPVMVANNTEISGMKVVLESQVSDHFQIINAPKESTTTLQFELNSYERKSVYYEGIQVDKKLNMSSASNTSKPKISINGTVIGAQNLKDNVTKNLEVVLDGFPKYIRSSGRISEKSEIIELKMPEKMIDGSFSTSLKVYPSVLSNLESSLFSLIICPHGCFEQVSSTMYPMICALKYLQHFGIVDEEKATKANEYLETGYKRLIGYECTNGGFSCFGGLHGATSLTAMGLLEFTDLMEVGYPVDPKMMERTKKWVLERMKKDSFESTSNEYSSSWYYNRMQNNSIQCYICYALSRSGCKLEDIEPVVNRLLKCEDELKENSYFLALLGLTMFYLGGGKTSLRLARLLQEKQLPIGLVSGGKGSVMYSSGNSLDVETTSLAVMLFLKFRNEMIENVEMGIHWISMKCKGGMFGSTRSTVLALNAIVDYEKIAGRVDGSGKILLFLDGKVVQMKEFQKGEKGMIELNEWKPNELLEEGKSYDIEVKIDSEEKGLRMTFAFDCSYKEIFGSSKLNENDFLAFENQLLGGKEGKNFKEGDLVEVQVYLKNQNPRDGTGMACTVINLPSGLNPRFEKLSELKKMGVIDHFELIGSRKVVVYFISLMPGEKKKFIFETIAEFPGVYRGLPSKAFLYYGDQDTDAVFNESLVCSIEKNI